MQHPVAVKLVGITKYFGQRRLFENINASVRPGQCLVITGPNGSGKSTLLKVLAGLIRPDAGAVRLVTLNREIGREDWIGTIGLISPETVFYHSLTGIENIAFLTGIAGLAVPPKDSMECLRTVGLAGREYDRVETYSTGMRQRLKFALLLAIRPSVWLLDEPSSNLDATGRRLIANLISKALASQVSIIMATNEREEADYAASKIALA